MYRTMCIAMCHKMYNNTFVHVGATVYSTKYSTLYTNTYIYVRSTGVTTDSTGVNHCDNSRPNLC